MVHPFCNVVLFDADDDEDDTKVDWQNPSKKDGSQEYDLKNVFEDSLAYFTCANKYASERESDRSWMSGGGHSLPRTYGTAGVPKRDS